MESSIVHVLGLDLEDIRGHILVLDLGLQLAVAGRQNLSEPYNVNIDMYLNITS